MKKIIKDYIFAFGVGSSTGGILTFSGMTLFNKDNLDNRKNLENIEKFTTIGFLMGGFVFSTIVNPVMSGGVLFLTSFPYYWSAKKKKL